MKITEYKEVTINRDVLLGIQCDVCGVRHEGNILPNNWHNFSEHHSDWGNDSHDSYEYYDVCSPKCYAIQLSKCIEHLKGRERTGIIDGMPLGFAVKLAEFIKI